MAWIGEGRESAASVGTISALGPKKSSHSFDDMILGLYDIPRLTKFDNAVLIMTIVKRVGKSANGKIAFFCCNSELRVGQTSSHSFQRESQT